VKGRTASELSSNLIGPSDAPCPRSLDHVQKDDAERSGQEDAGENWRPLEHRYVRYKGPGHLAEPLVRGAPDVDLALFLARVIVHAAVHEAAVNRPELLERRTFTEEVASLVHRYLSRPVERRIKRRC